MEAVHLISLSFLACQHQKDSTRTTMVLIHLEEQLLLLLMDWNS